MEEPWKRHERQMGELLGMNTVPMSGAGTDKMDLRRPQGPSWREMVSCKSTDKNGMRLTVAQWFEVEEASYLAGYRPLMALRLRSTEVKPVDLVVMDANDYLELREKAEANGGQE